MRAARASRTEPTLQRFSRVHLAGGKRFVTIDERGATASRKPPWEHTPSATQTPVPLPGFEPHSAKYATPVVPSKIVGIGKNYVAHAQELGGEPPAEPLLFLKPPTSLTPHGGAVVLPSNSEQVEFEGEIAVVIGARAHRVPLEHALRHVLGYTAACDVTARDLQRRDGQWTRAKGFDTFCPLGPWVVTAQPHTLEIQTFVNGQLRQHGRACEMVHGIAELVTAVSNVMTLLPGDVILTGTPEGVGALEAGDRVQVCLVGHTCLEFTVETPPSAD